MRPARWGIWLSCQNVCQCQKQKDFVWAAFTGHCSCRFHTGFFLLLLSFYQSCIVISWNMSLFKAWSKDKLNKKFIVAENFAELVSKSKQFCFPWRVRDLTLFEALTGGAFDCLNWQHSGEFDQNFSKKSNARGGGGDGWFWNWPVHNAQRAVVLYHHYHHFRWYATLKNKTPVETFPKFPSVLVLSTDRIEIHQSQPASMT